MSTHESKGRPTPKRKEAESKRKVSSLAPIVTKDQKRASKALARQDRVAQRAAYLRGDEAALPLRDRGAARRFVRNYVDSRRSTGEYFLPTIFVVLVLTLFPVPAVQLGAIALMYAMLIIAVIDGVLLSKKIRKAVEDNSQAQQQKDLECMPGFDLHKCDAFERLIRRYQLAKRKTKREDSGFHSSLGHALEVCLVLYQSPS
jgi:hypothetical protein